MTLKREQALLGQGAIILCAVLWSSSGLFIKLVNWHPILIAGGRSFLAAIFLFVMRIISHNKQTPEIARRPDRFVLIVGGMNYAATMLIFVIANKLTSSANAILLQYTAPVWAALLGWFFLKEKPRWEHWGAIAMTGAGLVLFFKNSLGGGGLAGDCLALVSGVSFAANTVFMRKAKDHNPADIVLIANIITALFSVPFFLMYPPALSAANLLSVSFLGIFQIGAASALFAYGIKRVSAIQSMLTATTEPVLNPVWVLLVTGEKPPLSAISGGAIIVTAVLLSSLVSLRRTVRQNVA